MNNILLTAIEELKGKTIKDTLLFVDYSLINSTVITDNEKEFNIDFIEKLKFIKE